MRILKGKGKSDDKKGKGDTSKGKHSKGDDNKILAKEKVDNNGKCCVKVLIIIAKVKAVIIMEKVSVKALVFYSL